MTVFAKVAFPLRLRRMAEPDVRARVEVLRTRLQGELRQLHRQLGITVFVTHDQEEAMILADRIAVIARREARRSAWPARRPPVRR
jgi:ABC-type Fe3+/spermidine/putrescine transport system ATPase subunit